MKEVIKSDLYRYGGLVNLKKGMKIPGFRFMYYFRKASFYKRNSILGVYYRYKLNKLRYKYGFQIKTETTIGKGFYIGHFGTIVINPRAQIGENCNIAHSTTIGAANRGKYKGVPTIGNNVWIGTGAVIIGKISIGNNVLIAPNTFVNIDVPENSIVIGNPAKIISKTNATEGYINNILK